MTKANLKTSLSLLLFIPNTSLSHTQITSRFAMIQPRTMLFHVPSCKHMQAICCSEHRSLASQSPHMNVRSNQSHVHSTVACSIAISCSCITLAILSPRVCPTSSAVPPAVSTFPISSKSPQGASRKGRTPSHSTLLLHSYCSHPVSKRFFIQH